MVHTLTDEQITLQKEILGTAIEAANIGGDVLLTHLSRVRHYELQHKDKFDFATEVDHASERAIIEHILEKYPEHAILAEESGNVAGEARFTWIIDPLDGTTNYIHDVRTFAISIAVMEGNVPIVGVVYDPVRGELFSADKGGGALLNGSPIHVSSSYVADQCLLATGFPFRNKEMIEPYLESFKRFFNRVRDIRRMGAAAIDLAYVASGRFDGFWELNLNRWDIAAGVVLVREAGGMVTGFVEGEDFWETGNIVASNGSIHAFILNELIDIFPQQ